MKPDDIAKCLPDDVVEAAAKAGHNAWRHQCAAVSKEDVNNWLEWEELEDYEREDWRIEIRAALVAGLAAWPGAYEYWNPSRGQCMSLPLKQEKTNEA